MKYLAFQIQSSFDAHLYFRPKSAERVAVFLTPPSPLRYFSPGWRYFAAMTAKKCLSLRKNPTLGALDNSAKRFSHTWILLVSTALTPRCMRLSSPSYSRPSTYRFDLKPQKNSVKQKISGPRSLFSLTPLIGWNSEKPLVSGGGGGGDEEWAECLSDVCVAEKKVTSSQEKKCHFLNIALLVASQRTINRNKNTPGQKWERCLTFCRWESWWKDKNTSIHIS